MSRNEQNIRQHKLLQLLEGARYGKTLEELRDALVDELGLPSLNVRTVRRDLQALQSAGFDIDTHPRERGVVWKAGPGFREVRKITASATELLALSLGRDLLTPLAGTPFWVGIESFWSRIREELPEAVWRHYEKQRAALIVRGAPAKSYAKQRGILATLHRAIAERRVTDIAYRAPGKPPVPRVIEPHAVALYQASLYVLAADHELPPDADRLRTFKLDRFASAVARDEWFERPADFDPAARLAGSLGIFSGGAPQDFRIRLSPFAAQLVEEEPWSPQQQLAPQPDGGAILTVQASHELDVLPRVLALGAEAELLAPASARKRLGELLRTLAERYA